MDSLEELFNIILLHQLIFRASVFGMLVLLMRRRRVDRGRKPRRLGITYSMVRRIPKRVQFLDNLLNTGDTTCKDSLRMNRSSFMRLCYLLYDTGGLRPTKNVGISEQVAMFLDVLSHHTKYRIIRRNLRRSGETISRCFNRVLLAVVKLHPLLLSTPAAIESDETDYTWKNFRVSKCIQYFYY